MCGAVRNRELSKRSATQIATRSSGMSGGDRLVGFALVEEGDRLELVVARPAVPEITGTVLAGLNPLRHRDRLAALCTGILLGQIVQTGSCHGALPYAWLAFTRFTFC